MRIILTREEVLQIVTAGIAAGSPGNWLCLTPDYDIPAEFSFVDATPEYIQAKADEDARTEALLAKWRAESAAKEAAKVATVVQTMDSF